MDTKQKKRRFLVISNIVISVLAAVAIAASFVLPLWKTDISVSFTDELGDAVRKMTYADKNDTGIRYTSAGASVKTAASLGLDGYEGSAGELLNAFIDALCKEKTKITFSGRFSSADMIGAVFDNDLSRAEILIDKTVDCFIDDTGKIIEDLMQTAVSVGIKEAVQMTVDVVLNSSDGEYGDITKEFSQSDKDRIDGIIDGIIGAIMDENATVESVTDTVLESADEIKDIISGMDRYKEGAELFDGDMRASLKENAESMLEQFADKDGRLNLKDTLVSLFLNSANEALESLDTGSGKKTYVFGTSEGGKAKTAPSVSEASGRLKAQVKTLVFNIGDGAVAKLIVVFMAVIGALLAVFLFMLFYPILRSLTNIGAENPGFCMFLPVFGGLTAFTLLVILPSVFPGVIKAMIREGGIFSLSAGAVSVLNAVTVKFSSGTVVAFGFAAALFVFSFFYDYQRRSLKKALAAPEAPLTPPDEPQQPAEPAPEQYAEPAPEQYAEPAPQQYDARPERFDGQSQQ